MGEVVMFNLRTNSNKPDAETQRRCSDDHRRALLARIDSALLCKSKLSPEDQCEAAYSLHELMTELESVGNIRKAAIMRKAGIGSEGDSTKHLPQYAIPRGTVPRRLTKKLARYVKLSDSAASLAGLDPDEVRHRVFGSCTFCSFVPTRAASTECVELSERLNFLMNAIAVKHALQDFFAEVMRRGGVLTPSAASYRAQQLEGVALADKDIELEIYGEEKQPWPFEFNRPQWDSGDVCDLVSGYPSLRLGALALGSPFPFVQSQWDNFEPDGVRPSNMRNFALLRLVIVPIGSALRPTPAIRVQLGSCDANLFVPPSQVNFQNGVRVEGNPMPPACVRPANFDKLPTALQGYFTPAALLSIQHWFFSLTPAVCADWLASTPASGTEWHLGLPHPGGQALERLEDRAIPILPDDRLQYSIAMRNYPFPFGTLAAELDCQLCAQEGGLDQIIDGIAEQNVAMFRNYYAQAHEEREAAWREIKERWRHYNQSSQAMETGKHE